MPAVTNQIENRKTFSIKRFFLQWEWLLVLLIAVTCLIGTFTVNNFWNISNILGNITLSLDKGLMVFPMAIIILMGHIDISIAGNLAFCSVMLGLMYENGVPGTVAILLSLMIGPILGLLNGLLVTNFKELPPMIITLSTNTIYRGVGYIILENRAITTLPSSLGFWCWGKVFGIPFPILLFLVEAMLFAFLIHRTKFGRSIYAIGNNETTTYYSGVNTKKVMTIAYTIMGFFAGLASLVLMAKMSSTRATVANNYEMDVIAMVVLGGISASGGKGRLGGTILSFILIELIRYVLGMMNAPSQISMIILGVILILSIVFNSLDTIVAQSRFLTKIYKKYNKNKKGE